MSKFGRDIALGIRMTKIPAPRVVTIEVPGPPVGPCTWAFPLLDTFDGSGPLSGHIGNSGAVWVDSAAGYQNDVPFTLASGEAQVIGSQQTGHSDLDCVATSSDYYVEAVIRADSTHTAAFRLGMRVSADGDGLLSGYVAEFQPNYLNDPALFLLTVTAWDHGSTVLLTIGPLETAIPGSTFTARVECVGSTIRVLIDGGVVYEGTDATIPGPGTVLLAMFTSNLEASSALSAFTSIAADAL
jgi:hypothetical protein